MTDVPAADLAALEAMIGADRLERMEQVLDCRLAGITVLLEDVYKPRNISACIRTLEAIGLLNVHVVEGNSRFEPHPQITRGCHKWLNLHRHPDVRTAVQALRGSGYRVLATAPDAPRSLDELDFSTPAALCFGNERDGITDELLGLADETFRIPMYGFTESFNISVALGISTVAAAAARRRAAGASSDLSPEERAALRTRYVRLARKNSGAILSALPAWRADPP